MASARLLPQITRLLLANGLIWSALWSPVFFFTAIYPLAVHAQKTEETRRKLLYKVDPQYPVILKASRIGGVVRLNVSISPTGVVQKVYPLGGSSPLVDAAVTAGKKLKDEPAFGWPKMEDRRLFTPLQGLENM